MTVRNLGVGGAVYHRAGGTNATLLDIVKARFASEGTVPDVVILAGGTNDMVTHDLESPTYYSSSLTSSMYAAIDVDSFLKGSGVKRVVWNTVYPFSVGSVIPSNWVPPLQGRVAAWNSWMAAMWGGDVVDTNLTLTDWQVPWRGDAGYYVDGIHPTGQGHARIAAVFPVSVLKP